MKLTKQKLMELIKESMEEDTSFDNLVDMLSSKDLDQMKKAEEQADDKTYNLEVQRYPSGFSKKEYDIYTTSKALYVALKDKLGEGGYSKAEPVKPEGREFVITVEVK